ncbi:MAG: 3-methylcrotonyl-CoA carboxylase [Desulfuromonas sp.]|nr:MAG: 3-methylcrotonyl-CoA carboxylase [Desulfuromonas sp.]
MFNRVLIANRGEIACRIIRTARRLGLMTVAVYSDADSEARHVEMADEAYRLGPAPAGQSYLDVAKILEIARACRADAIHPGYGFLAENASFAAACAEAGLVFVGPPVEAIEAMGSKSAAKQIMGAAGVPLVPGYHEQDQSPQRLQLAADAIGYPLLVKASAGGGGKGMRVVRSAAEFAESLAAAQREASSAFGDDRVLLEKYLPHPRHVEIQVFGDENGNVVHLFERDCSIQRRHQKVVEEAPAPGMTDELRERMGQAAIKAAKAIGYVGAGTVEFLLAEDGTFYFMEMNTRLQVEHPVTEMITGQDLVEWQFLVAGGESLPRCQDELSINGHAIEVRVYAEDPNRNFLPSTGLLRHYRHPIENAHVRIDSGVRQGDTITPYYDPMIAKLVVWDHQRDLAIRRLRLALADFQVVGVRSNVSFLAALAALPAFGRAALDTGFIEAHQAELIPSGTDLPDRVLALACLDVLLLRSEEAECSARLSPDPYSPWHGTSGWRLNSDNHHVMVFKEGSRSINVTVHYRQGGYVLELPGGDMLVNGLIDDSGDLCADLGGCRCRATVVRHGHDLSILVEGQTYQLTLDDRSLHAVDQDTAEGRLTAPMPGKIVAVLVDVGDEVARGRPLVVLEAMKMEHAIKACSDGTVERLPFGVGEMVSEGDEVVVIASGGAEP